VISREILMDDDYETGLSKPLSYGERRAIAEKRAIDKDIGKPFEDREEHIRRAKRNVNNSPRPR
jgi:hypothetical protein